jgi:molecular chaperone GrpE
MNDTLPLPEDVAAAEESLQSPEQALQARINELEAQLADSQAAALVAKDAQLRAMAESENVRRRLEREAATGLKYAKEGLLGELLPVVDSLELGLKAAEKSEDSVVQALKSGMDMTLKQLLLTLEKHGVKAVGEVGQPFNPDHHQAMTMMAHAEIPANHIVLVMQKGYVLHERVLRAAMVAVSQGA